MHVITLNKISDQGLFKTHIQYLQRLGIRTERLELWSLSGPKELMQHHYPPKESLIKYMGILKRFVDLEGLTFSGGPGPTDMPSNKSFKSFVLSHVPDSQIDGQEQV